jgi:deoxyribodipyrimidine photo-lyase
MWAKPGTKAGLQMLESFCTSRLKGFAEKRNNPNESVSSNLSPWLHFGQVSAQRAALQVHALSKTHSESVKGFIEESVIRRELADNYCFYNPNYDNIKGAASWAQETLTTHAKDKREYLYSEEKLESGIIHDPLWNAAQLQMVREGKMHGFLRMYWAKKILEWTGSPEEALRIAIRLNDRYELDGRDPNGYVGCMWSICGIHDQGWGERAVFGKIRYMNYKGCQRKFDVKLFELKYSKQRQAKVEESASKKAKVEN